MNHRLLAPMVALTFSLSATILHAQSADVPAYAKQVPQVKTGEPIFTFNGKDLTGFYTYLQKSRYEDPKKVFTVADGMIRVSGEEFGGFITKEEFSNYHLVVEWKWGKTTFAPRADKTRDSGILLHCVGDDGAAGGIWMESQECQIIEGGCGDFIMVPGKGKAPTLTCKVRKEGNELVFDPENGEEMTKSGGRYNWWGRDPSWKDVLGFRGARDVEKPAGEWNRMEVICDGDTIVNIVNGYVVNVGTKSSLTKGKILIQSEGAEMFVRKVEVRPLVK